MPVAVPLLIERVFITVYRLALCNTLNFHLIKSFIPILVKRILWCVAKFRLDEINNMVFLIYKNRVHPAIKFVITNKLISLTKVFYTKAN